MKILHTVITGLDRLMMLAAGISLMAMMLLTCANIVLRMVWVPVSGTFELMGFLGAIAASLPLGHTLLKRVHISVDVLIDTFPLTAQRVLRGVTGIVCTLFFAVTCWQIGKWATVIRQTGEVTETLRIVYYPFTYGVALGCGFLSLVCLSDLVKVLFPDTKGAA